MKTTETYECEFCDKIFDDRKECRKHEHDCREELQKTCKHKFEYWLDVDSGVWITRQCRTCQQRDSMSVSGVADYIGHNTLWNIYHDESEDACERIKKALKEWK